MRRMVWLGVAPGIVGNDVGREADLLQGAFVPGEEFSVKLFSNGLNSEGSEDIFVRNTDGLEHDEAFDGGAILLGISAEDISETFGVGVDVFDIADVGEAPAVGTGLVKDGDGGVKAVVTQEAVGKGAQA